MTRGRFNDVKVGRTTPDDVWQWAEAIYKTFHAYVCAEVCFMPEGTKLKPGVRAEVFVQGAGKEHRVLWQHHKLLELNKVGSIEETLLQLLSKAWIDLDAEQLRAEQKAAF